MLTDDEMIRYSRQILLEEVGEAGQEKLRAARILLVGAGGLGVPASLYLGACGIGHLGLADGDRIESTNLHRQVIYSHNAVAQFKTEQLQNAIRRNNPYISISCHGRVDQNTANRLIRDYDWVVDGSDNFPTRYLVNAVCQAERVPLISAALSHFDAQIMAFHPGGPCYRCLVPESPDLYQAQGCVEGGILGPFAGLAGTWLALEAIKQILELPTRLNSQLLLFDGLNNRLQTIRFSRKRNCPDCTGEQRQVATRTTGEEAAECRFRERL
jgi:molybdopterin/thiamine biosynthesis adenylyltransferase